jgi:hypothetical protein
LRFLGGIRVENRHESRPDAGSARTLVPSVTEIDPLEFVEGVLGGD